MRMSCNGCRVLRKGCSDACTIRPCLQWIKSPEAQANATVFLAKFYGRAGLLNLLAAPPAHLRPAVFRSLLYEACGRIVNPVYGSVGLLWSGQWQACQAAVEAVLKGDPVVQVQVDAKSSEAAAAPPLTLGGRRYDIRHVAKDPDADAAADLLRVARSGRGRKRAASSSTSSKPSGGGNKRRASAGNNDDDPSRQKTQQEAEEEVEPVPMVVEHDLDEEESAGSHDQDHHHLQAQQGSEDTDVEAASHSHSHVSQAEPEPETQSHAPPLSSQHLADHQDQDDDEEDEVGLELTLGLEPLVRQRQQPKSSSRCDHSGLSAAASSLICLRLQLPA